MPQLTQEEYDKLRFQNGTSSSEHGISLKDLGKKCFAFSLMEEDVFESSKRVNEVLDDNN